ncbi:MAG: SMC-Scp complex subunit ScpB [Nitriliruptoraceae bacterium]|nr:SMC-Scp complex subunit ScpB [Nitriliruptoraceae bacterium]
MSDIDPLLARDLEALLFLADEPLDAATLALATEADPEHVDAQLTALATRSEVEDRGLVIRQVAGGWRMSTAPATHPSVERWALSGRTGRLTQAALETLAVIAYKQPISRAEIGEIRGVNADGAVRSLVARGFVQEVGREPSAGQAVLYGTTRLLLERLGIGTLDELPALTDFLPEAPAPDEPELGALKEVRRRLAAGDELPVGGLGGRTAAQLNTGDPEDLDDPDEDDVLPQPAAAIGHGREDAEMDALTDRLETAARNAVDRLRAAVAAGERDDDERTDQHQADDRPAHDAPVDAAPTSDEATAAEETTHG